MRNSPRRRVLLGELATLGGVLAVCLLWGPSADVAFGVVAAMTLFIAKPGARVVNSVRTLQMQRSTLQRTAAANSVLGDAGAQTVVVELRGALFLGSAFAFSQEALTRAPREGTPIVVLEHVTDIDSSGAAALADVARACAKLRCTLRLAGRHVLERDQTVLSASGCLICLLRNKSAK
jgi:MFS superfamily sulfate permease-like transporter